MNVSLLTAAGLVFQQSTFLWLIDFQLWLHYNGGGMGEEKALVKRLA